ncbi:MAG TPA: glycosyltransferase family 2 protein [Thermoanaerobaculia bacterium]|nr:glycosyltransferase family 2 protein [Thermoanaerobaculia bacterium]
MKIPDASVVVVHHRGHERLFEALVAIDAASRGRLSSEVIVVDNASGMPVAELLRRFPTIRRITAPGNVGFAAGCRLGAESARGRSLVFVNDDAVADPESLQLLVDALDRSDPDVVAVAGRLTDSTGERNDFFDGFLTFDGHAFQKDVGRPVGALPEAVPGEDRLFACGGLMAVRRGDFLASGGFDDDYFAYLEDVDFGWRQWIFGRRIVAEPRAVARHRGGATGEALGIFPRGYLFEKNAFATAYKNFDRDHFAALMPSVLAAFLVRISEMLAARNPGAAELSRDPYAEPRPSPTFFRRVFGIAAPREPIVRVDDPLTIAHLKALLWIRRSQESLAAKRKAVQSRRRRSDAEIFARFPLRLVPTYPGDERFDSDFFREFLARAPELVRTTLDQIFVGATA